MHRRLLRVGSIAGIPVRLDLTWFILLAAFVWLLPRIYLSKVLAPASLVYGWAVALLVAVLFAGVVVLHELAHAAAARVAGLTVQNITLSLFGGGVRLLEDRETPGQELLISLAGPLATVAAGLAFGLVRRQTGDALTWLGASARVLEVLCIGLGALNLLPALPLDGGQALSAVLWFISGDRYGANRWAARIGQYVGTAMTIYGLMLWLVRDVRELVWLAILGLSIESSARAAQRRVSAQRALHGRVAADVMLRGCVLLDPDITLAGLDEVLAAHQVPCLIVGRDQDVHGMLTQRRLRRVRRDAWHETRLRSVMLPLTEDNQASPELPLATVLERMAEMGLDEMPVMRDGTLLGVVEQHEIMRLIESRIGLGI